MKTDAPTENVTVTYEGTRYRVRSDETLLAALQRQGATISFSCERGTCRACIQRCTAGAPPAEAQRGLADALVAKGYFLPCLCRPAAEMVVEMPRIEDFLFTAVVANKRWLGPSVVGLWREPMIDVSYRAGQFVNVVRADGLARSYSLASVCGEEPYLELHVQRLAGGVVSPWLCEDLEIGDELKLQGPLGECFYVPGEPARTLVLLASGTGIAPLYGIAKDAIRHKHAGAIHVYHVGTTREDLYLHHELSRLCATVGLRYRPYTLVAAPGLDTVHSKHEVAERAFAEVGDIADARIHIAGQRSLVVRCLQLAQERGVALSRVLADVFHSGGDDTQAVAQGSLTMPERGPRVFPPDLELWRALDHGRLLTVILEDFYTCVFADERLSPYFQRTTKDRIVGKVYSYLQQAFTGEKDYFGEHPRNAHHWMVIDDDLFDYRAALLERSMRKHGLGEPFIRRWCALEELFRRDIVKDQPVGRIVGGVEEPPERYTYDVLAVATVCDGCGAEIGAGARVRYHTRLGTVYGACCDASFGTGP
jgi:NAD(P)H-flavin reductase/ferredoxin/truncated hemoglobin YjbI